MLLLIGSRREDAVMRVIAFLWSLVALFIASFVALVGLVWGLIDVVWQLIFNSDGLSSGSRIAEIVTSVIEWPIDLQVYAYTGSGRMMWVPSV